jgi:hypothetical protein
MEETVKKDMKTIVENAMHELNSMTDEQLKIFVESHKDGVFSQLYEDYGLTMVIPVGTSL